MMKTIWKIVDLLFIAVIVGFSVNSCGGNPEARFKNALYSNSKDKVITSKEWEELKVSFGGALAKSRKGVQIGTKTIADEDGLIQYLTKDRKCVIEGLSPEEEPKNLEKFYMLLESSASMKGYVGMGNSDFAEPLIALSHCGESSTEFLTCYVTGDRNNDIQCTWKSSDDFFADISQGRFATGISSPLDLIFRKGIAMVEDGGVETGVFCLITDGLMSGTDKELAHDKDFNIKNLPLLEDRIRKAMEEAQESSLSCLIFRLETPFTGTYYDRRNGTHKLSAPRPYFLILVGTQCHLENIEGRLAKESNFTSKDFKRFASYDVNNLQTITKASLKRKTSQNGIPHGKTIEYDPSKAKSDPVVFGIQLQLAGLPAYYLTEIEDKLILTFKDKTTGIEIPIPVDDWLEEVSPDTDTKVYNLTVELEPEYLSRMSLNGEMTLTLPGHQDNWYRDLSSDDDVAIYPGENTTWALDRFMGGIMKGFGYDDTEAIPAAIKYDFYVKKSK